MKRFNLLICLLTALSSFAQYDGKDPDIASRFRPGFMWFNTGWRPAGENSAPKYDRLMLELSYNDWINDSALFLVKPSSIGFNVHGMWDIPLTVGNSVGLGIGLSYRYQHISYDGALLRDSSNRATVWQLNDGTMTGADRSVFGSHAFAIPFELRFRTPKWKQVKLHLGFHIGYRVQTYTKMWYNDKETSVKDRYFFDNAPFFYGVHARVGIRNWALFADYSISKQFSSSKSTALNPISFGITCSLF